jgi:hypothetical protein
MLARVNVVRSALARIVSIGRHQLHHPGLVDGERRQHGLAPAAVPRQRLVAARTRPARAAPNAKASKSGTASSLVACTHRATGGSLR